MMIKYILLASSVDIITKLISLILFIKRFFEISKELKEKSILSFPLIDISSKDNEGKKWSSISILKFTINIILTILSFSISIVFYFYHKLDKECKSENYIFKNNSNNMIIFGMYFIFDGLIWLLSSILLYKETNYYRNQSWNGLRFFWFSNGIFNFIKIASIILIFIKNNYKSFYGKYIICIHCFLSIILFYYSIFRPYDFTYKNIEKILGNELINNELNPISCDNSLLLDYTETFNDNNLNPKDDFLYTITIKNKNNSLNNEKPSKIKLFLQIKTNDFTIINFNLTLKDNSYEKEILPSKICIFLKKLIKIYKNKKYENNIINLVQQCYNISLTLDPKRNAYTGEKESINTLSHLFNETIKISNNFLLDLLLFLQLTDNPLVQLLKENNIESVLEDLDNFDEEEEDESILENNISRINTNSNFNISESIISNKMSFMSNINQLSRDMIKLYNFFNNILIKENFVSIKIIKYNEKNSEIECSLKTSNPYKEALININSENLLDIIYDDELKTFYIDNFNSIVENNDYSTLDTLFSDYLNNLIYYDENLFIQFQLTKILNLDIEKFNEELLINFFENEIECQNNIQNILFEIILEPFSENILVDKNIFSIKCIIKGIDKKIIINDDKKEIKINLNLIKLYIIIDNILPIINLYSKKNLNESYSSLNEIKSYIEKYIELIFNIKQEDIKKYVFKIKEEVNRTKYKKLIFGGKKFDEFTSLFERKLIENNENENKNLEENIIERVNEKLKEIGKGINGILNKKSLKYVLFFYEFRKILGIFKLFN